MQFSKHRVDFYIKDKLQKSKTIANVDSVSTYGDLLIYRQ